MTTRLAFTGDLVPSRVLPPERDLSADVREAFELLRTADLAVADLEMPFSETWSPIDKVITFGSHPKIAENLVQMGFRGLSLATNHSMDQGAGGLQDTITTLQSLGIDFYGAGPDLSAAEKMVVRDVGGVRVGFLGWSCLAPSGYAATDERAGVAPIHVVTSYELNAYFEIEEPGFAPTVRTRPDPDELDRACGLIRAARHSVDFLVVSMHWGSGSTSALAEYQRIVGHAIAEAGADLVIGAHVHAVQPVEVHNGTVIAYGLGNFVSQQPREGISDMVRELYEGMSPDALIALLDLDEDGTYTLTCQPVITGVEGLPAIPAAKHSERITRELVSASKNIGTTLEIETGRAVAHGSWTSRIASEPTAPLYVIPLGGTISAGRDSVAEGYVPAANTRELFAIADPTSRWNVDIAQWPANPSAELTLSDMVRVADAARAAVGQCAAAVVVMTGTDTLEEVAFALDLLWDDDAPLVVTGAMRTLDSAGNDGPANLRTACAVATDPKSRGRGVLVVMNDEIHAASLVKKSSSASTSAFTSSDSGPIGSFLEERVRYTARTPRTQRLTLPEEAVLPTVALATFALGLDPGALRTLPSQDCAGLVVEAAGGGSVSCAWAEALGDLATAMPVVYASRTRGGGTLSATYGGCGGEIDLRRRGLIPAGDLDAFKARVLLTFLLASSTPPSAAAQFAQWVDNRREAQ